MQCNTAPERSFASPYSLARTSAYVTLVWRTVKRPLTLSMQPQVATNRPDGVLQPVEAPAQRIGSVVLIALFTFLFYSFWWNRFLGGSGVDGVFFFAGKQILNGRIPYRDFSLAVTPWDAIQDAFLIRVFGEYLIVPRIVGLLERIVLASVMFLWLRRLFQAGNAFFGALVGIIVFSAAAADPVSGYNHDSSFWAVLGGYSASLAVSRRAAVRWLPAMFSGVFASLSLLTKQTTGAGATAVIGTVLVLTAIRTDWRVGAGRAIAFTAGWLIPFGSTALWLRQAGGWAQFVDQVFISGPSSKGSLAQVFTRPLAVALHDSWLRQELAVAIVVMAVAVVLTRRGIPELRAGGSSWREVLLFAAVGIVLVIAARTLAITGLAAYSRITSPHRILMFISLFGSVAAALYYSVRWVRGVMRPLEEQLWLVAAVSAAVAYMHSLSFVVTESMSMPGLPFLIALALDRLSSAPIQRVARAGVILGGFAVALTAATYKFAVPFAWYGWAEQPVQFSTETSSIRQLAGLHMSARSRDFIEHLERDIEQNRTSPSSEYAFFYLPLAYILTDGYPPTIAFNHFIDVAPDAICRKDANTLLETRPSVIVYTPVKDGEIAEWEHDFRASHPSGQRDLVATLDKLTASDYRPVETLRMPGSERAVIVYTRK